MKKHTHIIYSLIAGLIMLFATEAGAQTSWTFGTVSDTDKANITADATNWYEDAAQTRYNMFTAIDGPLTANNVELEYAKGLKFKAAAGSSNTNGKIRLNYGKSRLELNGKGIVITIPGLKAGNVVTVSCETAKAAEARGLAHTNLNVKSGFTPATGAQTCEGTVVADGNVTLTTEIGGVNVYSIKVEDAGSIDMDVVKNATFFDATKNQMNIVTKNGKKYFYNTESIGNVDFTGDDVIISPSDATKTNDVFKGSVEQLFFTKATEVEPGGDFDNPTGKIKILEAKGWFESSYIKWELFSGAKTYNVYVKGGQYTDFTKIDYQLVRNYGTYGRADVVGLKAGDYTIKIVPVSDDDTENTAAANEASALIVKNHNRNGYAFKDWTGGIGAYNADGTLKSGAKVLYITNDNFNTIQLEMATNDKGGTAVYTGLGEIFKAKQKGYDTTPLAVRFIGQIDVAKIGTGQLLSDQKGLLLKGNNTTIDMAVTCEGIGDDASFKGLGFGFVNGCDIELRNMAVMLHGSSNDCVEIKGSNHIWVHNCDLFYGEKGGGDHDKGDGSMDCKDGCSYATFSYNHFVDAGKSILCGMKNETVENLITYHHNWFDHSDSRHPRVRTSTVHVYNNYYDGVSKYGIGATMGCSIFAEANYFRGTKRPMMSSRQGTDAKGDGTFSGEGGGNIKSFNNVFAEKPGTFSYITHEDNATSFDAYEAKTRDEKVPSTYKVLAHDGNGSATYSNFDTASSMYQYTVDDPENIPSIVRGFFGAGRLNHGDIHYTFNNATDDDNYGRIAGLDALLSGYKCGLVKIFDGKDTPTTGGGDNPEPPVVDPPVTPTEGTIICSFEGKTPSSNIFTIVGNYATNKGTATYNGQTYSTCLKMESSTSIKFTASKKMKMTLAFADAETGSIKINGTKQTSNTSTLTSDIEGAVELTKADTRNLFVIVLEEIK